MSNNLNPISNFLNFIFPHNCIKCKDIIQDNYAGLNLCTLCHSHLKEILSPYCEICSTPFFFEIEYNRICEDCKKNPPIYAFLYSATEYNDVSAALIHAFKYKSKYFLAKDMALLMVKRLKKHCTKIDLNKMDMIIPIPLFHRKKRERGFNQSELLARHVAELSGLPLYLNVIERIKDTLSQSTLDLQIRDKNIKGAFAIKNPEIIKNKKILLIDDVYTTGATVNECSKVLIKAGCEDVRVMVFARTLKK